MIKERNGTDLTEAEETKKKWQGYTEELYQRDLNDPDNHNGVVTHLESDILECEVKWALGSTVVFLQSLSCFQLFAIHGLQHACPLLSPRVCSNSCPLSGDAIQPSQPLSPPSPPALSLSQHQGLFQ